MFCRMIDSGVMSDTTDSARWGTVSSGPSPSCSSFLRRERGYRATTSNGRRERLSRVRRIREMEDPMLIKFVDGPLDGQERTLDDESIEEGAVITLPS